MCVRCWERHTLSQRLHNFSSLAAEAWRWMQWILTVRVCHRLGQGDFSDGQGERLWSCSVNSSSETLPEAPTVLQNSKIFFPTVGIVCRFSQKKTANCFRSPRPLVSAGTCLLVFNAAEWQMRIRDHEMASSVLGPALWDSQTLSSRTPLPPMHPPWQKNPYFQKKKKFWVKLKTQLCVREVKKIGIYFVFIMTFGILELDIWKHLRP